MNPKLLPTVMVALQLGAGIAYAIHGDWRKAFYWLAAMAITITVTF